MKTIIIDGNNLIHKVQRLKLLFEKDKESAQLSLIESIKVRLSKSEKTLIVFDGFGGIKRSDIIYSNNHTADEVIRLKIEKSKEPKKLKVISSDKYITDFAKVCGCEIQNSEDFWIGINQSNLNTSGKNINQNYEYDKPEKPDRISKKEVDEFKKYFS